MTKLNNSNNNSSGSIADEGNTNEELSNAATNGANNGPNGLRKGPWTAAEDTILIDHVRRHGEGNWNAVQKSSGLARCGKSCRLRWANHLRPNLKKGPFSPEEELLILRLHARLGNKWARISTHLPGRTDNEIKNYWNTRLKRRQRANLPLYPPEIERELGTCHKLNQNNMPPFPDNRNPNLNINTQLGLLQPSPINNFNAPQASGIGPNPFMNQSFQNFPQFPNQMQNDLSLLQYGGKAGHNQRQFGPHMGYRLTSYDSSSSNMRPSFPIVKTELSSNQIYMDQASVQGQSCTNNMGGTIMYDTQQSGKMSGAMYDAQQVGNFQNMQKMPSLPSLPQLVRGHSNSNWSNGNSVNMGDGNNNGMNLQQQGDGTGLGGEWTEADCMNGGTNNMPKKQDIGNKDSTIEQKMEELSNLIDEAPDMAHFTEWFNPEMTSKNMADTSTSGGGGRSVITDDGMALGMMHQQFVAPLTH